MLNPNWPKYPYKQDLELWAKVALGGTEFMERNHGNIERLLDKYFVTKKWGGNLGPGYSWYQKLSILGQTMAELENAIPEHERKENEDWHAQRDREEDLGARLTREDEIERVRRESSSRKICISQLHANSIELGRFWINKYGEAFPVSKDVHHAEWIMNHPDILNPKEMALAKKNASNPEAFLDFLFANGWIRISGFVAEMYSEYQMPNLAEFLKEKTFDVEQDDGVTIIFTGKPEEKSIKIKDIISRYGKDAGEFQLTGSIISSRDLSKSSISKGSVPNPLRQNYDYSGELGGPEWQNRVKNYKKLIQKRVKEAPHDKRERD